MSSGLHRASAHRPVTLLCVHECDTATSLVFAWPVAAADQCHTVIMLEYLTAPHGWPLLITSDKGTHFTGQEVQAWTCTNDVWWQLHVPYHPQTAGMIEQFNSLLKDKLQALGPGWRHWYTNLPQATCLLNEWP